MRLMPHLVVGGSHILILIENLLFSITEKPGPPAHLHTTEVWSTYIGLGWDEPADDGGAPVTSYNVEMRDTLKAGFKFLGTVDASIRAFQVSSPMRVVNVEEIKLNGYRDCFEAIGIFRYFIFPNPVRLVILFRCHCPTSGARSFRELLQTQMTLVPI